MDKYYQIFKTSFSDYASYLWREITIPSDHNYFYLLIGLSLFVWLLEVLLPWRKNQNQIRKDFWLDGFYMFFNFFLFSLVGYNAISNIGVELFNQFLGNFGINNLVAFEIGSWPRLLQLLTYFLLADFIQWNVHRLLHRVPWLWEFHKLHHSVKEMGFAAHLRFHWMETIVYKSIMFVPLSMIGFSITDMFIVHAISVFIGHLNHANLNWDYGIFKYILNNPKMHLWHHVKKLPENHPHGINYGISLSIWDYLFGTAHVEEKGGEIELGFDDEKEFPKTFFAQIFYPFWKNKKTK